MLSIPVSGVFCEACLYPERPAPGSSQAATRSRDPILPTKRKERVPSRAKTDAPLAWKASAWIPSAPSIIGFMDLCNRILVLCRLAYGRLLAGTSTSDGQKLDFSSQLTGSGPQGILRLTCVPVQSGQRPGFLGCTPMCVHPTFFARVAAKLLDRRQATALGALFVSIDSKLPMGYSSGAVGAGRSTEHPRDGTASVGGDLMPGFATAIWPLLAQLDSFVRGCYNWGMLVIPTMAPP